MFFIKAVVFPAIFLAVAAAASPRIKPGGEVWTREQEEAAGIKLNNYVRLRLFVCLQLACI